MLRVEGSVGQGPGIGGDVNSQIFRQMLVTSANGKHRRIPAATTNVSICSVLRLGGADLRYRRGPDA
jgi:hypothetical protein